MKKHLTDKLSNFFFDCGKLSFAGLVLRGIAKKPLVPGDLWLGVIFTLILVISATIISLFQEA